MVVRGEVNVALAIRFRKRNGRPVALVVHLHRILKMLLGTIRKLLHLMAMIVIMVEQF